MKKYFLTALLALFLPLALAAQEDVVELRMVSTDSLVSYLRGLDRGAFYFRKDADDRTLFTVKARSSEFFEAALAEIRSKGYNISRYDGAWFILRGKGLVCELPAGYFIAAAPEDEGPELIYADDRDLIANFQNKVYEIGDKLHKRDSGTGYVKGYVRNSANGEALVGVAVISGNSYVMTDSYGYYCINLPVGENRMELSGYSLDPMELKLLVYGDGNLDVMMKETVISLKGAVVQADRQSKHLTPAMGVERINASFMKTLPAAFGESDVIRAVMTLPGVKSVGEAATGINVRGGSVDQNLILFNEATIYNPSHMFGIMSTFDTEVVSTADLYKSSIPMEYGGRLSSVLDIRSRSGNSRKFSGSVGLGLLTSRLSLEGPLGSENTTFMLGGRTTYSDWMMKLLPESSAYAGGKASFSDVNAGISHKFSERNSLQAFGYWSRDRYSFCGDTTFRYSNASATLRWRHNFSEKSSLSLSGVYDRYQNRMDDGENSYRASRFSSLIQEGRLKAAFKSVLNARHSLSYGAELLYYNLQPGTLVPIGDESMIVPAELKLQQGLQPSLWIGDDWKPLDQFELDYGLRVSGFIAPEDSSRFYCYPEFRLSAKYSPLDNLSIKAGVNTMTQYIHLISNSTSMSPMDCWQLSNARLRPQLGFQGAGGLYWTVWNGMLDLSLEGYWKNSWNSLDYKSGATLAMNPELEDELVRTRGRAWGVELMARKSGGKFSGWVSYTYSRSQLREMENRGLATINNGDWYNAPYDKPHDLKFFGNFKFTHRFSLSCNLDYSTGRPVTVPVGKYYYDGGYRLAYSQRNAYRIPDYFRMDLAVIIEPSHNLRRLTHFSMTFSCYNVTARKNAYSVYYTTDGGGDIRAYKLSVFACPIPYVNFNLKF